jgi:pimeloyl-ACP methyl ester carboxylesterase
MTTVRTQDGVILSYQTFGSGPLNILFMHGWGGSGAYFDEMLKHLDLAGLRVITYDLRGHGASDKPQSGYMLEQIAQDAWAVADHANADPLVVVGFSMSGKFAQYVASMQPERVRGLILVAGCPVGVIPLPEEIIVDWAGRAGNREQMMEITRMYVTRPVADGVIERWGDDAAKIPQAVLDTTLRQCLETSFVDRLDSVRMPTLVIGGVHDTIFSPDVIRQGVAAPLANARVALLDCNHEIPIEQPQEFAALISAFTVGLSAVANLEHRAAAV